MAAPEEQAIQEGDYAVVDENGEKKSIVLIREQGWARGQSFVHDLVATACIRCGRRFRCCPRCTAAVFASSSSLNPCTLPSTPQQDRACWQGACEHRPARRRTLGQHVGVDGRRRRPAARDRV